MSSPPSLQPCGMTTDVMPLFLSGVAPAGADSPPQQAPNADVAERPPERPSIEYVVAGCNAPTAGGLPRRR
ncbi:hypothetical protein B7R77_21645 [Ralstonia solanacearum K60]|uniref:Uncharacterized protein n=1 Tax=Ralstonia solanacearum K60 TaxID=1091042 RepID=A0AAP8D1W6_RALSL|nr:hypothetical protein B7R77_21645 [Ralstonia solanacearum K60]RIJ84421.1 hypothetical protein RSP822_20715 [Ralstonia solanacearum]